MLGRRVSNPVLNYVSQDEVFYNTDSVTYSGVTLKTLFLLALLVFSGTYVALNVPASPGLLIGSVIVALIAVIVGTRNPALAMPASIIYALAEGVLIGTISMLYNHFAPGIVGTAVIATVSVFFIMLVLYQTGVIRVTNKFNKILMSAFFGVIFFYLITLILSLFGFNLFAIAGEANMLNIMLIVSVVIALIAAFFIVSDLDRITTSVQNGVPKEYEWTLSLGLMVTLIWLYIQILRILAILAARRD